jgi:hypothetical protein
MKSRSPLVPRFVARVHAARLVGAATALVAMFIAADQAGAQSAVSGPRSTTSTATAVTATSVVVTGEELPSSYGAPPAFSRTRFAPSTTAYVLPPWSVLAASIYQGDAFREGRPDHLFTQEIEVGLPYRFGIALETSLEAFHGVVQGKAISLEARYALADWNKIPLNPTIFAEYKWGVGRVLHEEALGSHGEGEDEDMPEPDRLKHRLISRMSHHHGGHHNIIGQEGDEDEDEGGDEGEFDANSRPDLPDAIEGRLLLAQDFGEKVEWALNGFFEQELSGDRGREWGAAQSITVPLTRNEWLKAGVEMQYTNFSDKDLRDDPEHRFVVGPTIAWKPARWCRLDVSELFGCTNESPAAQTFVVFSMLFGGPEKGEAEAPVSTRNR